MKIINIDNQVYYVEKKTLFKNVRQKEKIMFTSYPNRLTFRVSQYLNLIQTIEQ